MPPLRCKPVALDDPAEMRALQQVFEGAPDYSMRIMGHPPGPAEAQSTVTVLPPDKGYEDKHVFGLWREGEMIGCADVIRGYPDAETAHLGLLLFTEREQRRGHGREAYALIEQAARGWGARKLRLAAVSTNDGVLPFWRKMGFSETGERKPYRYDRLVAESIIMEKEL